MATLTLAIESSPTPSPPLSPTLTPEHIAFIMSKSPEHFDLLSRQSPTQLTFYMSLSPVQFDFHITIHRRALESANNSATKSEQFKELYTVHFLATGMILQAFPPESYPEHFPDTPPMTVLKQLIREKSQYFVDTYGVGGVVQKLAAGDVLEYGKLPDGSTALGERCLHITKMCIERMGGLEFEQDSLAGILLWQLIAEQVLEVIEKEMRSIEKQHYRKSGRDVEEVKSLVGTELYDTISAFSVTQRLKWRTVR